MSFFVSCNDAGMMVAPSLHSATAHTQYSQRRRRIIMTTSPLPMPSLRNALAARFDSFDKSSNVKVRSSSRSSHHTSARFSGSTRAHSSTTSKPKLNASGTSILKFSKKSSYESNSMRGQYFFRIWFTGCASYSAMIVTNFAGTSPPQRWPCGCSGLK